MVQVFHQVFANVWYSSDKFLDSMHGFLYIWHGLEFYWFDILYCKFNCLKTINSDTKLIQLTILHEIFSWFTLYTVLINIGTGRSEQTVQILIRQLLKGSLIRVCTVFPCI